MEISFLDILGCVIFMSTCISTVIWNLDNTYYCVTFFTYSRKFCMLLYILSHYFKFFQSILLHDFNWISHILKYPCCLNFLPRFVYLLGINFYERDCRAPWFSNSLCVGKLSIREVSPICTPAWNNPVHCRSPPLLNSQYYHSSKYLLIHQSKVYQCFCALHFFY